MINNEQIEQKEKGLATQVEQYETLKFYKSYRGIAAILTTIYAFVTPWTGIMFVGVLLVLAFFTFKGKLWAMIPLYLYLPFLLFIQLSLIAMETVDTTLLTLNLLACVVVIRYIYLAHKIERLRKVQKIS